MVTWVDSSHYQTIDLPGYFAGHDRLGLKVSESTGYEDPTFAPRYAYARAHGWPVVLYHFDRARFDGAAQFDHYLDCIRRAGGPRPYPLDLMCLDSEDTNYPAGAATAAARFTARAVAAGFPQGSMYSGVWYATPNGLTPGVLQPGWRQLWLSDYTASHTDTTMPLPAGWARGQVLARQYTSTATVAGVGGPCDANRVIREWLTEGDDMTQEQVDALTSRIDTLTGQVGALYRLLSVGDAADTAGDPGTHPWNMEALRGDVAAMRATVTAGQARSDAAVAGLAQALAQVVASGTNELTPEKAYDVVARALRENEVHVDLSVRGIPATPAEPNV